EQRPGRRNDLKMHVEDDDQERDRDGVEEDARVAAPLAGIAAEQAPARVEREDVEVVQERDDRQDERLPPGQERQEQGEAAHGDVHGLARQLAEAAPFTRWAHALPLPSPYGARPFTIIGRRPAPRAPAATRPAARRRPRAA